MNMRSLKLLAVTLALVTFQFRAATATQPVAGRVPHQSGIATFDWISFADQHDAFDGASITEVQYLDDQPRWSAWAGAIFLTRSNPTSVTLISSAGTEIFNARQFRFGTSAGPDLNLVHHGDLFDVDIRYFQVNQISAQRTIIAGLNSDLNFADPLGAGNDIIGQLYTTGIQSAEINLRRNLSERLTLLAGFRYIALDDDLRTRFDLPLDVFPPIDVNVDAINRLYGGQAGADAILWSAGRFQLLSAAKAGIYGNVARNAARIHVPTSSLELFGTRGNDVAFVGDVNISGVVKVTEHLAVRGGYQLLWLSGVALSSEQYPIVSPYWHPDLDVVTSGDLFMHGALVSIEAVW